MSIDKYRFVSPGVQVAEIDLSRRSRPSAEPGPVIIGRFERGPTMRPVKVDSLNELEEIFGSAITGRESSDISRNGNFSAPSYAAFAANAWLKNQGGATIIRLVGKESDAATAAGAAGWSVTATDAGKGGAWGLWVCPSGSTPQTGTLGAIFYCTDAHGVVLSGTYENTAQTGQAACAVFSSTDGNFRAKVIKNANASSSIAATTDDDQMFNFNPQSRRFIRKVFNTTPHNTNSSVVADAAAGLKKYWLGETFEDRVQELLGSSTKIYAFTAPLLDNGATTKNYAVHEFDAQPAKSGWVISQDVSADTASYTPENMTKLFRFVSLEEAEWTQRNLKISIRNIRLPNSASAADAYGTFDVQIRKMRDTDAAPESIETYTGCNLNPASANYIAARIGDQYASWSDTEKRYRYFGSYPNASKYIRMEMAPAVDEGSITEELVPFGFYGVPVPPNASITGAGTAAGSDDSFIRDHENAAFTVDGVAAGIPSKTSGILVRSGSLTPNQMVLEWPRPKLVQSASAGILADPTDRYFGYDLARSGSETLFDASTYDLFRARGAGLSANNWDATGNMVYSHVFSLDDVSGSVGALAANGNVYVSGSRRAGTSVSATGSDGAGPTPNRILDAGYDRFTLTMHGGYDGLDITEMEPLINNRNGLIGSSVNASYTFNTLMRSIDTVSDPEIVDMNLLLMPGVHKSSITDHMINTCERRRDAMAIIDLNYAYTPRHESSDQSESSRNGASSSNTVTQAVGEMKRKGYNSSYAAAYYPWVQVRAPVTGLPTWCPPSVVALGAMSYGQATQAVWFAPAGFTRGGLTEGRGGLPVVAVSQRLSSKERDKLYEVNINPIAQFPAEGIVIFGQKTLQATPTALDRINVRRLLIFIKKRISRIASTLLFEPNVSATWGRFTSQVAPFLDSIKTGFGLDDFRVVLDETTTTADLIDRNTMYAKIFVKPTKAIEFIAIDFIITNSGASFDD